MFVQTQLHFVYTIELDVLTYLKSSSVSQTSIKTYLERNMH